MTLEVVVGNTGGRTVSLDVLIRQRPANGADGAALGGALALQQYAHLYRRGDTGGSLDAVHTIFH